MEIPRKLLHKQNSGAKFELYNCKSSRKIQPFLFRSANNPKQNLMLNWRQFKLLRSKSNKGKKPKWFELLEKEILANNTSRHVKHSYEIGPSKLNFPELKLAKVSDDKRQKEWVMVFSNDNQVHYGKTIKKTEKKLLIEHWSSAPNKGTES